MRTQDEINKEFTNCSALLGHKLWAMETMPKEMADLKAKMDELSKEKVIPVVTPEVVA